ncbi:MAG: hypothetical protein ACLU80_03685 [Dorea sp.]
MAPVRQKRRESVLGIVVTVVGSSIAREADARILYSCRIVEISAATSTHTKRFYILAIPVYKVKITITEEQYENYIAELQAIPEKIEKIIEDKERIQWFAEKQANAKDAFFVGRGIDYAICGKQNGR